MTDPYRGSSVLACPRCNEQLPRGAGGVVECPRDCGLWDEAPAIDGRPITSLGEPLPKQVRPGPCPSCRKRMIQRIWDGLVLEVCAGHGTWVDRSYRKAFAARVVEVREREREAREEANAVAAAAAREQVLVAQVVAQLADAERHPDFARRLLALEERVEALERVVRRLVGE